MSAFVEIIAPLTSIRTEINLPASKSLSNRLLIIRELCSEKFDIHNLSEAQDTQTLLSLLQSNLGEQDCGAGGTTFRFLLALRAMQEKESILTGSSRMKMRPVADLVNALRKLGASIDYLESEGFPPVKISKSEMHGGEISVNANTSSQFITALMLIAPKLIKGLAIHLKGKIVSGSYIEMTSKLMREFGVDVQMSSERIHIPESGYIAKDIYCPPDWTSASYWYGLIACLDKCYVVFKNLNRDIYQGDGILQQWMENYGVVTRVHGNDIHIYAAGNQTEFPISDFTNHPDLVQTFVVIAAVKGIPIHFIGLSTLRIKETDRLFALKTELEKTGVSVIITDDSLKLSGKADPVKIQNTVFETYEDHRMAMALSILSTTGANVRIENPDVVNKSYPSFFEDLKSAGFKINFS